MLFRSKSPTKQFKRGASGLKGVNRQFSKSPSVSKKVSPPLNINLSPKLVKEDFSLKLVELINDKSLRNKLGENAQKAVLQKFHYTQLVNNIEKLYNNLLEKYDN